jgi:hypothetical protein
MIAGARVTFSLGARATAVALLCCMVPFQALAKDELPVNGSVYKPPNSSSAYVTLKGPGALQLYKDMTAKPVNDECRGNGRKLKWAGNLACSLARDGASAECDFGVNIRNGRSSPGKPC